MVGPWHTATAYKERRASGSERWSASSFSSGKKAARVWQAEGSDPGTRTGQRRQRERKQRERQRHRGEASEDEEPAEGQTRNGAERANGRTLAKWQVT